MYAFNGVENRIAMRLLAFARVHLYRANRAEYGRASDF
jgi:hypothetical protein